MFTSHPGYLQEGARMDAVSFRARTAARVRVEAVRV